MFTVWGCGVDCAVLDQTENTALLALLEYTAHLWPLKGVQHGNKSTLFTLIFSPIVQ